MSFKIFSAISKVIICTPTVGKIIYGSGIGDNIDIDAMVTSCSESLDRSFDDDCHVVSAGSAFACSASLEFEASGCGFLNQTIGTGGVSKASSFSKIEPSIFPHKQTTQKNSPLIFSSSIGNAIVLQSDLESVNEKVRVYISVPFGNALSLSQDSVHLSRVTGNGSSSILMHGKIEDINAALNGMTFIPDPEFLGDVELEISINDQNHVARDNLLAGDKVVITVVS